MAMNTTRRRRRREEEEHTDRWLVSYADFITLLFAFFTTLYAISHVDAGKLEMFTGSMRSAFKAQDLSPASPVIEGIIRVSPDMLRLETELREIVGTLRARDDIEVRRDSRGVVVSFGDNLLFHTGDAAIREDAAPALTAVAAVLKRTPFPILIEGHTDNVPLSGGASARFASNWELSSGRAASVLHFLLRNFGLAPERFSVSGYGEFRPVSSNMTPEGRAKNRRVDIVLAGSSAEGGPSLMAKQ